MEQRKSAKLSSGVESLAESSGRVEASFGSSSDGSGASTETAPTNSTEEQSAPPPKLEPKPLSKREKILLSVYCILIVVMVVVAFYFYYAAYQGLKEERRLQALVRIYQANKCRMRLLSQPWSQCSQTCGSGVKTRVSDPSDEECKDKQLSDRVSCNPMPCPEEWLWAEWSPNCTSFLPLSPGEKFMPFRIRQRHLEKNKTMRLVGELVQVETCPKCQWDQPDSTYKCAKKNCEGGELYQNIVTEKPGRNDWGNGSVLLHCEQNHTILGRFGDWDTRACANEVPGAAAYKNVYHSEKMVDQYFNPCPACTNEAICIGNCTSDEPTVSHQSYQSLVLKNPVPCPNLTWLNEWRPSKKGCNPTKPFKEFELQSTNLENKKWIQVYYENTYEKVVRKQNCSVES